MKTFGMKSYAVTDLGPVRKNNEDSFFASEINCLSSDLETGSANSERIGLYILCDGMGGHQKGEVASSVAVNELKRLIISILMSSNSFGRDGMSDYIKEAVRQANDSVLGLNLIEGIGIDERRMGTTVVMALVIDDRLYVSHVGDSRCYLVADGQIELLTEDHSLAMQILKTGVVKTKEEAEKIRGGKTLIQALGPKEGNFLEPGVLERMLPGDCFLVLCSDGLSDVVSEDEILSLVKSSRGNVKSAARRLVKKAIHNNTADNTTVIAVKVNEKH